MKKIIFLSIAIIMGIMANAQNPLSRENFSNGGASHNSLDYSFGEVIVGNGGGLTAGSQLNAHVIITLDPISGPATVCSGSNITLSNGTAGGTWSSGNTAVATVGSGGVVTGVAAGTAMISYTVAGIPSTTTITVTGGAPTITSVSPQMGYPASSVTITGTNFSSTPSNNIVFFGATQATVTSASLSSLTVTVPTGATYMPVSVDNIGCGNLTGYSLFPFLPTYNNSGYVLGTVNLNSNVDFATGSTPLGLAVGDIDGDGKPDLVVCNYGTNTISVYHNTSTSGTLSSGSFAAKVDFVSGTQPREVVIGDLDGDGKPDIVVSNYGSATISVFHNTSTSGVINSSSLGSAVSFTAEGDPSGVAINDINGDGKPEIIVVNYNSNTVSVYQNVSSTGSITTGSFAGRVDFTTGSGPNWVSAGDLDGDGLPDLAVANYTSGTISVFHNTTTLGGTINSSSFATKVDFTNYSGIRTIKISDIDGDGKPEMVASGGSVISVYHNTSVTGTINSSSFAANIDFATGNASECFAFGDIDGDGKVDIVTANLSDNTVSVLLNTAAIGTINTGSFATQIVFSVDASPYGIAVNDLDGDGKPDIAVVNHNSNTVSVFRNNPLYPITGFTQVCVGASITLSDATTGGTWSSGNTAVATVGTGGVVTGVAAGTATISYNMATYIITVDPLPASITGASSLCTGAGTTLSDGTAFGAWSSGNPAVATVGSSSGLVSGVAAGVVMISYTLVTGCSSTTSVTVNAPALFALINTIAGNGTAGFSGDGGPATAAEFNGPNYIVFDAGGNMYIPDWYNQRIRKISAAGIISTVAGTGTAGYNGDNMAATSAQINYPNALAVDAGGNLYISEWLGHRIRKVSATGIITTVAGTGTAGYNGDAIVATTAKLDGPSGVAIDASGNIYIADDLNQRLRMVNTSGVISTIGGTGAPGYNSDGIAATTAQVHDPQSIQVDAGGNVYFADYLNSRIRKINTSGIITTIAGNGTSGYTGDGGQATNAEFAGPSGLAIDAAGNLYIDGTDNRIRMVNTSGIVSTLVGNGTAGFTGDGGPATAAETNSPGGVAIDGSGNIYFPEGGNNRIRKISFSSSLPAIAGSTSICIGTATTLSNAYTGGAWSSSNTAVATVGSSGVLTGIASGTSLISYLVSGTCNNAVATTTVIVTGATAITSVTPLLGYPASTVTINGTNFNTTAANDAVYFGATQATVTAASGSSLTVTVPSGATYMPVSVDNLGCNLTGFSEYPFLPSYNNSGYLNSIPNFDGHVDFTTGSNPSCSAIGDIDGDGKPDIVIANWGSNTVSVYRNISSSGSITSGSFASGVYLSTGSHPETVALGDIDGDGKLDIVTANEGAASISLLHNTSVSGSISAAPHLDFTAIGSPFWLTIGDFDMDGKADIAVAEAGTGVNTLSVFRNTATAGTINSSSLAVRVDFPTGTYSQGIAMGDIDGDGKPDIAVGDNVGNTISVFRNTSSPGSITSGSFATKVDFAVGSTPDGIAIGDIDGDGKPELVVACNGVSIFRNTATSGVINSSSFASPVNFNPGSPSPYSVAIGDFNGDGKPDIATPNSSANNVSVYLNTSSTGTINSSSLASAVSFGTGIYAYALAVGDLDGDGKADLAVPNGTSGTFSILRNDPLYPITGPTSVCIGSTITLSETTPGGAWNSNNTAVATVNSGGVVTGISGGTATISYNQATINITVIGAPTISTVSPLMGYPASSVVITGTDFNSTATNNVVFFGATQATVSAATTTSLTVTVPIGATYMPVSVDNIGCDNLIGYSEYPFLPTFNNTGNVPGVVNFNPNVDFAAGTNPWSVAIGDIDGDGKPDIVVANGNSTTISVYRNTSTSGSLTSGSFAPKVDFTTGGGQPNVVVIGDLDGDGKPDIAVANADNATISVFRNTATPGSITSGSLASQVSFNTGNTSSDWPYALAIGDIDGDGRPDIAVANRDAGTVALLRNTSATGSINFAARVLFTSGTHPWSIAIGDIDGDGKPDVVTANQSANTISVFHNTATIGTINTSSLAAKVDFATNSDPRSVIVGDIDGDGKPELIVGDNSGSTVSVFHNTSTAGTINSSSFSLKVDFNTSGTISVAIGDFDGDGKPDLAVANSGVNTVSVFRNTATLGSITTSSFAQKVDFPNGNNTYAGLAVGDLDGDGKADIVVGNYTANTVSVIRNNPLSTITGYMSFCITGHDTLNDATAGGIWASSNTSIASVGTGGVVTGVSAGTVIITYTVPGGSTTAMVTVTGFPNAGTITGGPIVCTGSNYSFTDGISGGVWGSSNTSAATIGSTGTVTGVAIGTAVISYVVSGACGSAAATTTITINQAPASITGGNFVCQTATTTLSNTTPGGAWVSSNTGLATVGTNGLVTGVNQGTVVITYSTGCGTAATQNMTIATTPSAIVGLNSVCQSDVITLEDAIANGLWSSGNTAVATVNAISGVVYGVSAGTAIITYSTGCGSTVTQSVSVNALPYVAPISGISSICTGSTALMHDSTAGGAWFSSNTGVATVDYTGLVTGMSSGFAAIIYGVYTSCGIQLVYNNIMVISPAPISGTNVICPGTTTGLSDPAAGGSWSSSNTSIASVGSSGIVTGVSAGTAIISYMLPCGAALDTVTVSPLPNAGSITGTGSVCTGAVITLTDTAPGGAWSSSSSNATVTGGTVNGVTAGTALISYTVTNSCGTASTYQNITINPLPFAGSISGAGSVCTGTEITLTDAAPGGAWSSSSANATVIGGTVTGVNAGTAIISYAVTNSCGTALATQPVTINPSPGAGSITGAGSVCVGAGITLTDAAPGGAWSSSSANASVTSGTVSGVSAGTSVISYTVTNSCGTAVATWNITINPLPNAGIILGGASVNIGSSITLTDAAGGGTWSETTGNATISGGLVTGVTAGLDVISYTVSNGCGTASATKTINITSITLGPITGPSSLCAGASVTLSDSVGGGSWSSGNTGVATVNSSSGLVTGVAGGTAVISYSLSGSIATTIITVVPVPGSTTGAGSVCQGSNITLSNTAPGGIWSSSASGIASAGSVSGIVNGVSGGVVNISYTTGCGSPAIHSVTVVPVPSPVSGPSIVCNGGSVTLTDAVSGGAWSSNNMAVATVGSNTGLVSGLSLGVATISYNNGCGVASTQTVSVVSTPAPIAGITTLCSGSSDTLTDAIPGGNWSSSNTGVATIDPTAGIVTGVSAGTALISYNLSCGVVTTVFTITQSPAAITGPAVVCQGGTSTYTNTVSGGIWTISNAAVATVSGSTGMLTGVSGGADTLTYTVGSGCSVSALVTISSMVITGVTTICAGSTTVLSNSSPGGTWTSSNTAVAAINCNLGIVSGVSVGTAVISYSLGSGCMATTTVKVISLTSNTGISGVCVGSTSTLANSTSGGAWSSSDSLIATVGAGTGIVTGLMTGNVNIIYSFGGGCSKNTLVTVLSLGPNTGNTNVCPGLTTALNNVTVGGTWSSANNSIATVGSTSGVVTGVNSGTVAINYNFGMGCVATTTVNVNPVPTAVTVTGGGTACGFDTLNAAGGGTGTTIYFQGTTANGTSTAIPGSSQVVGSSGTYYFRALSSAGCWGAQGSATVLIPVINGVNTVCLGSSTTLTNSGGSGAWASSNTAVATIGSTTGILTGVAPGNVIITSTLSSGCMVTSSVSISPSLLPITGANHVCVGQTINLSNPGTGGAWSSSAPTVATVGSTGIVTGIAGGLSATITYTSGASTCKATMAVSVSALSAISGPTAVCIGQTITLTDATSGGTWSAPGSAGIATVASGTGIVTGVAAGTATISYNLPSGCIATYPVPVKVLSAITGTLNLCQGQTITLTDTTSGGTWSTGAPTVATIGSLSGIVTGVAGGLTAPMTYTLGTGCRVTATVMVNSLAPIGGPSSVCQGQTITLTNSVSGGTWSSGNIGIGTIISSGVMTGVSAGIVTISYILPTGCTSTEGIYVNPVAAIAGPGNVCLGQTATLTDAAGSGTWSTSAPTIATINTNTGLVTGVAANLSATITYTFCTGCKTTRTISVSPLSAITGASAVCQGQTTNLTDATAGGTWSSSNGNITIGSSGTIAGINPGIATISYNLPTGCIATATKTVNPLAPVAGLPVVCKGKTITLTDAVTGGTWTSSTPTVATAGSGSGIITGITAGLGVTITYSLASGCKATTVVSVVAMPAVAAISGPSTVSVSGSPITLTEATGGGVWSSGNPLIASVGPTGIVTGVSTGAVNITYMVTNAGGCDSIVTKWITVGPVPPPHTLVSTNSLTINVGSSVVLPENLQGGSWTCSDCNGIAELDSQTGKLTGLAPGRAELTYTLESDGGASLSIIALTVNSAPLSVEGAGVIMANVQLIPNPNKGDFTVRGVFSTGNNENVTIEVSDMLGQVIYKTQAAVTDGRLQERIILSNNLPNGMYILSLQSTAENDVFHFVVEK